MKLPLLASLLFTAPMGLPAADEPASGKAFKTPEAAWKAFVESVSSGDWAAVEAVLGPAAASVPPGARAQPRLKKMAEDLGKEPMVVEVKGDQAAFMVSGRAFPVGVRKTDQGWVFAGNSKGREEQASVVNVLRCSNNLKLIGRHCLSYQTKNGMPVESLESLLKAGDVDRTLKPSDVLCPLVGEKGHRKGIDGVSCDYLYVPVKTTAAKDAILAFCPKGNHPGGVRQCVFVDGHVDKIENEGEFRKALRASLGAAGISIDSLKDNDLERPVGLSRDPGWRKAIRAELGAESAPAGEPGPSSTEKKGSPSKKPVPGKKTKKGTEEPPVTKDQPK